jgi:hypothetical protein
MGFLVYCDADENGNITNAYTGYNVIPSRQYQYFFYMDNEIDIMEYKIDMGSNTLILK